jgi:hypothetical protein
MPPLTSSGTKMAPNFIGEPLPEFQLCEIEQQ